MTINVDELITVVDEIIEDHMDSQPYQCKCMSCGAELEIDVTIDTDMDMKLSVEPCQGCLEIARQEVRSES